MTNLRPFDLEAAKRGEPVLTLDGRKARYLCDDLDKGVHPLCTIHQLCFVVDGVPLAFMADGRVDFTESVNDLFMDEPAVPDVYIRHDGGSCPVDALEVEVINKKTGGHFVYSPSIVAWDYVSAYRVTKIKPAVPEPSVEDAVKNIAGEIYGVVQHGMGANIVHLEDALGQFADLIIKEARR